MTNEQNIENINPNVTLGSIPKWLTHLGIPVTLGILCLVALICSLIKVPKTTKGIITFMQNNEKIQTSDNQHITAIVKIDSVDFIKLKLQNIIEINLLKNDKTIAHINNAQILKNEFNEKNKTYNLFIQIHKNEICKNKSNTTQITDLQGDCIIYLGNISLLEFIIKPLTNWETR